MLKKLNLSVFLFVSLLSSFSYSQSLKTYELKLDLTKKFGNQEVLIIVTKSKKVEQIGKNYTMARREFGMRFRTSGKLYIHCFSSKGYVKYTIDGKTGQQSNTKLDSKIILYNRKIKRI